MTEAGRQKTGTLALPGRRRLLAGLGSAGGALLGAQIAPTASATPQPPAEPDEQASDLRYPFYGTRQSGVTTPRQPAGLVAAFDVLASDREDFKRLMRGLTNRIEFLTRGGPVPQIDPKFPAPDSGLLGPVIAPAGLTMTVAVGASLFRDSLGLSRARPKQLTPMIEFPNDALDFSQCHGDLLIQLCSNRTDTNIHALRDVVKNFPDLLSLRWKVEGFNAGQSAPTPRNLLGFKDGTANPEISDAATMDRIVWIGAGSGEPDWATGGAYQVVRIIRNFVEHWDRTPLQEQQTIIGREKTSGAPLTATAEFDVPDYASDPTGKRIPLTAHIRLANPRVASDQSGLILRRGYNFSRGVTKSGQMDMGLLFICFQADLANGFIAAQTRLNGEPLEEYIQPVGGGYYFVLPGVHAKGGYLAQSLIESTEHQG